MSPRQRSPLDAALPRVSRYRFRLRDDAAQRAFALPPYLAQRRLCGFNLDQEPSERAAYGCGHQLMVDLYDNQQLVFRLSGIADWKHEDRPHDFAESVRETSERIFGTATSRTANLLNELDRFSIP